MASRGRQAAREQEMRALLERWERSGLPLARFAEREGTGRKTLYRWRQRIGVGGSDLRRARRSRMTGSRTRGEPLMLSVTSREDDPSRFSQDDPGPEVLAIARVE